MARVLDMRRNDDAGASAGSSSGEVTTGNDEFYRTVLSVNTTLAAIAGGAALGVGNLIYTFPAGNIVVHGSSISLALDESDGNVTADTPEIGLGTVIASGANATLGAVGATSENIMVGQVAADCNGTATAAAVGTQLVIAAAGAHTVYLNVADTWAASGEAAMAVTGTVTILWSKL